MDSNRPYNIEKRIKTENRIKEFSDYVNSKQKTHQAVTWAHGRDVKRIYSAKKFHERTQKDLASVIMRQNALKEKLSHEQALYKIELSKLGLSLENVE